MSSTGLYQQQSLKQVIGPQMQQSLQILQAASLELRQIIQQEMAVNPVIEVDASEAPLDDSITKDPEDDIQALTKLDEEWREYYAQSRAQTSRRTAEDEERHRFMMDSITAQTTLQEHLVSQLSLADVRDLKLREHCEFIIGSIDDDGFLHTKLPELSLRHGLPLDKLEQAKKIVQGFEPAGIGAEDLRECLLLQLERQGKANSLAHRIVDRYLDDLAHKRWTALAKKLATPPDQITKAVEQITALDPRPAQSFAVMDNHYVTPDIHLERTSAGYIPVMNERDLPHLRISNAYKDLLAHPGTAADARSYIREKIRGAKFLIRSVAQRQETIQKIATEIIRHQRDFLDHGPSHLKPLNMATVAAVVGVHETTVSRAIAGKYMSTPHGVVELRYFFTSGVRNNEGEDVSNTAVKTAIAEIIKTEPPQKPWSDEHIVKQLAQRSIKVARRTVAKYREAMGVLPSHLRKSA
ncbi:MAG: RNA polymerase factor sigma-54 [Verrucomicrobia bacterium]|nr:RNA polymerase factor sigma-54 [Verrucomicrobiota bacterium]